MTPDEARRCTRLIDLYEGELEEFIKSVGADRIGVGAALNPELAKVAFEVERLRRKLADNGENMARMIAGMREEWGVKYEYRRDGQSAHVCRWVDIDGSPMNHHAARRIADRKKRDGYDDVRIVRRYVTEPEEA